MKKLVVLSGAGISVESGLTTFRGDGGLWEGHRVEEVASIEAWEKDPQKVLRFYNQRRASLLEAVPNKAHQILADLTKHFHVHIITQNIDDLHERAGSRNVLHLHGEILKKRSCLNKHKLYPYDGDIALGDYAPDGGQFRPHIVWFGEAVPLLQEAAMLVQKADIFVIIGTSLQVYPAASLLHYAPKESSIYCIDPNPVKLPQIPGIKSIPATASQGMQELSAILRADFGI